MHGTGGRLAIRKRIAASALFAILVLCCSPSARAQLPTSPPGVDGPVAVRAAFQLLSISAIDDNAEKIAFSGVLTLAWKDARKAFDPSKAGVAERVYSGSFQFNELSPGWYPQLTLANAAGQYDSRAITLRVKPDGTHTLSEAIEAVAKVPLNMRRFPFDRQRLELVFRVVGFDSSEVVLTVEPDSASITESMPRVAQWTREGVDASTRTMNESNANGLGTASAMVITLTVKRDPLFMLRLVVMPLSLIVVLSWSVFWMDCSSLGDRMSVSFVGILTAVAYQITLVGIVPNVSYLTLMNGFLNISFLVMCAAVVINLYVGVSDRSGSERGDRIDRRCRWLFPLVFLGLNAITLAVAFAFF